MLTIFRYSPSKRYRQSGVRRQFAAVAALVLVKRQCLNCRGMGWLVGLNPPAIFSIHPTHCQILFWGVSTYSTRTIYIVVWKEFDSKKTHPSYFSTIQTLLNGLLLNPRESSVAYFSTRKRLQDTNFPAMIMVAGSNVDIADSRHILGVTLDSTLSLDQHVNTA